MPESAITTRTHGLRLHLGQSTGYVPEGQSKPVLQFLIGRIITAIQIFGLGNPLDGLDSAEGTGPEYVINPALKPFDVPGSFLLFQFQFGLQGHAHIVPDVLPFGRGSGVPTIIEALPRPVAIGILVQVGYRLFVICVGGGQGGVPVCF